MSVSGLFYIIGGQFVVSKLWHLVPISGYAGGLIASNSWRCRRYRRSQPASVPAAAGTRTIFLEEIGKDYVRTARAKGLSELRVLFRHVLKNADDPDPDRRRGGDSAAVHGQPAHRIVLRHPRSG